MITSFVVNTEDELHFTIANVARLPKGDSVHKSAVLVARVMGCLAVRLLFDQRPVPGANVRFYTGSDPEDTSGELTPHLTTDENGVAVFPRLVTRGLYTCSIDDQRNTVIPTVDHPNEPYPVVLPIGRPITDIGGASAFTLRGV
jgi:hypothetical protein